ncbi:MAG: metal-dependent transcriptional regulator [Actinomycetaceae bacterium]|nr:metal-dependent transcriptional regulator [Actinomycetaceae bacterium]
MGDLIDTTEMYLKTVLEMEEDGVTPLRARIVERLGHSGPTVSQTVGRMERDGLLHVMGDRRLELSDEGRAKAIEVLRKHRLAERLLVDVIGLKWVDVHEEACRWEHVMSAAVEQRLVDLLENPEVDPYGNPIPGSGVEGLGKSVELVVRTGVAGVHRITRIGEPVQAEEDLIADLDKADLRPGGLVTLTLEGENVLVTPVSEGGDSRGEAIALPMTLASHLFVDPVV